MGNLVTHQKTIQTTTFTPFTSLSINPYTMNENIPVRLSCEVDKNMKKSFTINIEMQTSQEIRNIALCEAVKKDDLKLVHFLITNHSDPNYKRGRDDSPIELAIANGSAKMCNLLIAMGAWIDSSCHFHTRLYKAVTKNSIPEVKCMLQLGAEISEDHLTAATYEILVLLEKEILDHRHSDENLLKDCKIELFRRLVAMHS